MASREFSALGIPFNERTSRLQETIAICRMLWTEPTPSFEGRHSSFGPSHFEPKPPQGRIPIVIGGHSEPALRRAGRVGDGWFGTGLRAYEIPPMRAIIEEGRSEADRLDEPYTMYVSCYVTPGQGFEQGPDHLDLSDRPRARDALQEYAAKGTDVVVVKTIDHSANSLLAVIDAVVDLL